MDAIWIGSSEAITIQPRGSVHWIFVGESTIDEGGFGQVTIGTGVIVGVLVGLGVGVLVGVGVGVLVKVGVEVGVLVGVAVWVLVGVGVLVGVVGWIVGVFVDKTLARGVRVG